MSYRLDELKRRWYKFSRNPLSLAGLMITSFFILLALIGPYIVPYPEHAGFFVDRGNALKPPSLEYLFGTDNYGRDILTRSILGLRYSLSLVGAILAWTVPVGFLLGLIAGYYRGGKVEHLIMRVADVFIAVPSLVLALAVCVVMTPGLSSAMLAISITWWPWYVRLIFNYSSSIKNEYFVKAAEITGASTFHIIFGEILPNCLGPILTKVTLDAGWVVLIGAFLSYLGLGAQPPVPDLGTMVSDGSIFLPDFWWVSAFPAMFIVLIILGLNLLGDGIRDMFVEEAR